MKARRPKLVMLTRVPVPGLAKTRLIPLLGAEGAAEEHRLLAERTLRRLHPLAASGEIDLEVCVEGSPRTACRWLGRGVRYSRQYHGDLGDRIRHAFEGAFDACADACLIVGSDCPGLSARHVREALSLLAEVDLVLGPARDGGYYLIGLKRAARGSLQVLMDVPWSTERVLSETLAAAGRAGLRTVLLEDTLADVDTPEDLQAWRRLLAEEIAAAGTVTVVIPAINEGASVAGAVTSAFEGGADEVLVVDGGSGDETVAAARAAGAEVLTAPRGRSTQLNAGAAAASSASLVFLHADTRLPLGFAEAVRSALAEPGVEYGAFEFTTSARRGIAMRVVELTAGWRARLLRMPYGDQALFLSAGTFHALGGFPDIPVMEDYELVRRLRRIGACRIVPKAAITSGRAWSANGVLKTTVVNKMTIWGYIAGVSPERLAVLRARISPRTPSAHYGESSGLTAENDAQSV